MQLASRFVQCRLPQVAPRLQIRHLCTSQPVPTHNSQKTAQEPPHDSTSKQSPNNTSKLISETSSKAVDAGLNFAGQAKQYLYNIKRAREKKAFWTWFKVCLLVPLLLLTCS